MGGNPPDRRDTDLVKPRLIAVLAVLLGWSAFVAAPALAQEQVTSFDVAAVINADTTVSFHERIVYEFPAGEARHGIERDLVLREPMDGGGSWQYGVTVTSVTADGKQVPYEATDYGDTLSVRIGDPDALVSGTVTYEIDYDVTGALRAYATDELTGDEAYSAGDVEFYWDMIGSGWNVPISTATAEIEGPQPALAYACYAGAVGSESECAVTENDTSLIYGPVDLQPGGAMTAVVAYPGAAFTVVPTPEIVQPGLLDDPAASFLVALPIAIIALAAPIVAVLVARRRLRGAELDGSPVQFEPPGNLRPAQLQASATGQVNSAGALATLLDLVGRGHITMKADEGGFLQKSSITIARREGATDSVASWEEELLHSILSGREEATLEGYNAAFAAQVTRMSSELVTEAKAAGRWSANRNPGWRRWLGAAMVVGVLLGVAGVLLGSSSNKPGIALIGCLVGGGLLIGGLISSRLVPIHQTQESAQFLSEYRGFRQLLDTDAAGARRELVHRMGLPDYAVFASLLPYAVIYGLEDSWNQAFPDLTPEDLHRTGYYVGSMAAMNGLVAHGRGSMQSATRAPGSGRSSGSGFSGGSAGGGGGGGGGGSW